MELQMPPKRLPLPEGKLTQKSPSNNAEAPEQVKEYVRLLTLLNDHEYELAHELDWNMASTSEKIKIMQQILGETD